MKNKTALESFKELAEKVGDNPDDVIQNEDGSITVTDGVVKAVSLAFAKKFREDGMPEEEIQEYLAHPFMEEDEADTLHYHCDEGEMIKIRGNING